MKKNNEKAIIERIIELRKQYAGERGRSKFALALGISASTYSYYENDRVPPVDVLLKMCQITGSDLQWLIAGGKRQEKAEFGSDISLLRKLDELLSENPDLKEPVLAFIDLLCEKKGLEGQLKEPKQSQKLQIKHHEKLEILKFEKEKIQLAKTEQNKNSWIPVLGRTAAGIVHCWSQTNLPKSKEAVTQLDELVKKHLGKEIVSSAGGVVKIDLQMKELLGGIKKTSANLIAVSGNDSDGKNDGIVQFVECAEILKLFPDSFALQIDGDSMAPRINDGDVVVVSPSVAAAQGQIGVTRIAEQIGVTCKLIRSDEQNVHLIPINEKYETKIVAKENLLWALAVLCHISL